MGIMIDVVIICLNYWCVNEFKYFLPIISFKKNERKRERLQPSRRD